VTWYVPAVDNSKFLVSFEQMIPHGWVTGSELYCNLFAAHAACDKFHNLDFPSGKWAPFSHWEVMILQSRRGELGILARFCGSKGYLFTTFIGQLLGDDLHGYSEE